MRTTFFKIFLFCVYGFSVNAQITYTATYYTAHISWPETPGALWYDVLHNGRHVTRINSTDTWIWLASVNNITIEPHDTADTQFAPIVGSVIRPSIPPASRISGDLRPIVIDSANGLKLFGNFTAADRGKVISIKGACVKSWYRDAPLYFHGWVKSAGRGFVVIGDSVNNGKLLGDPISSYTQPQQFEGYIATNKVSAMRNLLRNRSRIVSSGIVYLDGFRDSQYVHDVLVSQRSPALFHISRNTIIEGVYRYGQEEQVGTGPASVGWYSGNFPDGHTHFFQHNIWEHYGGNLTIIGDWRGPQARKLRNQAAYDNECFYTRNPYTDKACNLFFRGNFGWPDYEQGTRQFAFNGGGYHKGKEVIFVTNSTLSGSELFGLRPYYTFKDSISADVNKRLVIRNTTLNGAGYNKMTPVTTCTVERGVIKAQGGLFGFMQLPAVQYAILLPVGAESGPVNEFKNAIGRTIEAVNANTARVADTQNHNPFNMTAKPLPDGKYWLVCSHFDQTTQPNVGHQIYMAAVCQLEESFNTYRQLNGYHLRQSDAPGWKGNNSQLSLYGISVSDYTTNRFTFINRFGGYSQYEMFSCCVFLEAQGAPGLRYAIGQGLDDGVRWQIRNLPVY